MKSKIFYTIKYLVIFCIALEGCARIDLFFKKLRDDSLSKIQIRDKLGTKGVPYAVWRNIKLNKYGFNDKDDYEKNTKSHSVRIMCLGDSITFGAFSAPYNWPIYLEKNLRDNKLDVEVINASMPGNNYSQIVNRFEADYLEFEPDILIIYKGFRHYMVSPSNPGSGNSKNRWTRLLKNSSFAKRYLDKKPPDPYKRLLKKRKQKGITEPITIINKGQLSRYRKDLQHLVNLCSTNRITLIVSPFPHLVNEDNKEEFINEAYKALYYYPSISVEAYIKGLHMFNAVTKQIASEHGLLYIDINRGLERSKDFFVDNYHLTRKGAEVVANNFSEVLFDFVKLNFPEATIRQTLAY